MQLDYSPKEKFKEWTLAAFKIYVVLGFVVWKLLNLYISGNDTSIIFIPSSTVAAGYVICLVFWTFTTGVQYGQGEHKKALHSAIFVLLGAIFLWVTFESIPLSEWTIPWVEIATNLTIFGAALIARRRFKARALTFWIWASSLNIIRELGMKVFNSLNRYRSPGSPFFHQVSGFPPGAFMEAYWIGGLVSSVLFVAGIILSVRQLRAKETVNPSPNTAMFVALAVMASIAGLPASRSLFQITDFLPVMAINLVLFCACIWGISKYQSAFLCLALAVLFTVGRTVGLDFYSHWSFPPHGFDQWFLEFLSALGIVAGVLRVTAIILIIRQIFIPVKNS
jgi:hypothetical protein